MGVKLGLCHTKGRTLMVSENRVLRTTFGSKMEEVEGSWRRLSNGELQNLSATQNIIRVIQSRRMRMEGHVSRMGGRREVYKILLGNLKVRDHSEDLDVDGMEHDNEPSYSIKTGNFLAS
jgi:hypothetical protein